MPDALQLLTTDRNTTTPKTTPAMNEKDVLALVMDVVRATKDAYVIDRSGRGAYHDWAKMPELYEGYLAAIKQRDRIANHAEADKYPEMLFKERAPNETEVEANYIRANYKNVTHPVFVDYLSVVGRSLADGNWSLRIDTTTGFNDYAATGIEYHKSIEAYIKEIVLNLKAKDPNGVIVIEVPELPMVDVNGTMVPDDRERYRPQPKYYPCERVMGWDAGKYAIFESYERSRVYYTSRSEKIGRVFYVYTREWIWKVEQVGKFVDHNFVVVPVFRHALGYLPCEKLKGVPTILPDNAIYYTSKFYYAVDPLDNVLTNANYLQCSVANCMFPFRVMVGDACDFSEGEAHCTNGFIPRIDADGEFHRDTCPSCKGSGMKVRVSPMGTYLLKPREGQSDGDTSFAKPVEYITPSTEAGKFVQELIDKYTANARSILHIHTTSSEVKGRENRTATGDAIDLKAMYAFVRPESEQIFDLYEWMLKTMAEIRREEVTIELSRPRTFDFRTDADLLADIKTAKESGAPDVVLHSLIYQYMGNRYYSDGTSLKIFDVIAAADRLLTLTSEQIVQRKAQNLVQSWEVVLHDSAMALVNELIAEDDGFIELALDEQVARLVAKAKEKAPTETTRAEMLARLLAGG